MSESPVGCSGSAYQKPIPSEPAATLFVHGVVGIGNPERRGTIVCGQQAVFVCARSEAEVAGDDVTPFGTVLEEEPVAQVIEADVVFDDGVRSSRGSSRSG